MAFCLDLKIDTVIAICVGFFLLLFLGETGYLVHRRGYIQERRRKKKWYAV